MHGPVGDLFNGVGEDPLMGGGKCFLGDRSRQCNITYKKNVALWCRCSVHVAE